MKIEDVKIGMQVRITTNVDLKYTYGQIITVNGIISYRNVYYVITGTLADATTAACTELLETNIGIDYVEPIDSIELREIEMKKEIGI